MRAMKAAWETEDELQFITDIGTIHNGCKQISRRTMLQRYLRSLDKRTNWKNLNRKQILTFVVKQINQEK